MREGRPRSRRLWISPLSKKYFFGCKNLTSQKKAPTTFSLLQHARIKSTVVLSSAFVFLILLDFRQADKFAAQHKFAAQSALFVESIIMNNCTSVFRWTCSRLAHPRGCRRLITALKMSGKSRSVAKSAQDRHGPNDSREKRL